MKLVLLALDRMCVALSRFPTKHVACTRLIWVRPFATDTIEFSQGTISFEQPLGAAMLSVVAGRPVGLSNTQNEAMYGWSSGRGVTNEIFIAVLRSPYSTFLIRARRLAGWNSEFQAYREVPVDTAQVKSL